MYKAILCDEDSEQLQLFRRNIDWKTIGIELQACCSDGFTARDILEKECPDILISSVRVLGVGGLELGELAKQINPEVRVILMSDREDFSCAVRAIRLGVRDFLCKPVSISLITNALNQVVEEFHKRKMTQALISESRRNIRREQIQCLVFEGTQAFEERYGVAARQQMLNMSSLICVIGIDNFETASTHYTDEERSKINRDFFRILESFEDRMTVFEKQNGKASCSYIGVSRNVVVHTSGECTRRIRENFQRLHPELTVTFAFSTLRSGVLNLQRSYNEALQALQERFVRSPGSEIYFDRIKTSVEDVFATEPELAPSVTDLVAELRRGSRSGVRNEIDKLGKRMQEMGGCSHLLMKYYSGNIFFSIQQDLRQYGINLQQLDLNLMREYQQIIELQNINLVMRQLYSFCARIMDALEQNGSNNGARAVVKARAYIDENYNDHSLSMEDVAGHVHMSPSYFSVIFKQETGISFTDYLISLRIRKSKELIRNSDLKIYEIATRSGYDTAAYYSTAFKKETGMSPSEYKKKYLKGREMGRNP